MEKKTSKNVWLIIMGVLVLAAIVIRVFILQTRTVFAFLQLLSLVFTALYCFFLYKKPHGNMLKYAMLIFVLTNIIGGSLNLLRGEQYQIAKVLASAALCYCAGRLNRIEQNKILLPIIGIVYLGLSMYTTRYFISTLPDSWIQFLASFTNAINYLTLLIAYFVRFKEHKEAGLTDAPTK